MCYARCATVELREMMDKVYDGSYSEKSSNASLEF